jgi:hypothetical protein
VQAMGFDMCTKKLEPMLLRHVLNSWVKNV